MDFHSSTARVVKPNTSIPFIAAFQRLEIRWRTFKLVERWSLRFLYQSLVHQSNSPCCYYTNTCLRGQKCNYTVINQSDSFRRNSADFKFVCMQVYQTLLLLHERGSGSETKARPNKSGHWHCPGLTSNVCHFDLQANGAFNGFTFPNSLLRWPSTANHSNQLLYAMVKAMYKYGDEENCIFIRVSLYEYSAWYLTVIVGRSI